MKNGGRNQSVLPSSVQNAKKWGSPSVGMPLSRFVTIRLLAETVQQFYRDTSQYCGKGSSEIMPLVKECLQFFGKHLGAVCSSEPASTKKLLTATPIRGCDD